MHRRIIDWIDHRTGVETAVKSFLYEDIPASSGWHQVFGSVALFLFLLQAFTGVLLAFNYAPTPGDSYHSLRYILTELTGGRFIRNLHHWTASAMIVVVVLHMIQVALYGAYKKPREATWIVGVFLLLITLGFGLTGYLLPWDNKAYWGTVVTTQIAAKAPVMGEYLSRFMGGEGPIGVVTFARFYALHVMLLPAALAIFIAVHVYLVRKHGVAPAPGDNAPPKKFYPEQVFRDTVAIFIAFAILFVMAVAVQAPLERLADPTDTSYIPRPEWYFLFLFQILKVMEGPLEVFGAVILPGLAVLCLILVPFFDRGKILRVTQRTTAWSVVFLALLGWTGLTVAAIATTPASPVILGINDDGSPKTWTQLAPADLAAIGYFRQENCTACHKSDGAGIGPDLATRPSSHDAEWTLQHLKQPQQQIPGSQMPPVRLTDGQLRTLSAFLTKLSPDMVETMESAPSYAVKGAMLYQKFNCQGCHQVNGLGMTFGPPLNGLRSRRSKEWVVAHFREPKKFAPNTPMPPYDLPDDDMENLTNYLLSLAPQ